MKKYLVRFIAVLPMLAVSISMVVFIAFAFDNAWWILLAIGDFWALQRVCRDYEWYVKELASFLRDMAIDALHE
jgi:hypothetical protein